VSKRAPGVLRRFGGHAMAAGASIEADALQTFRQALEVVAHEWLEPAALQRTLCHDGPLPAQWFSAETARLLDDQVWGQGFEAPVFCDEAQVLHQALLKERHLKLRVRVGDSVREAVWFQRTEPLPEAVRLAYRLVRDDWNGRERVQMIVEAAEPALSATEPRTRPAGPTTGP
jgi:single-stranded-DNA-specific exonuclease